MMPDNKETGPMSVLDDMRPVLGFSAGGRTRTGMVSRRILSAVRLPIPPHRRIIAVE